MRYRQENKQPLSQKATAQSYIKKDDLLTTKEQEEVMVYFTQSFRTNLLFFRFLGYMHFFFALFYAALLCHGNGTIDVHLENEVVQAAGDHPAAPGKATATRHRRSLLNGEGSVLVNMAVCAVLFAVSGWRVLQCIKIIRLRKEGEAEEEAAEGQMASSPPALAASTPLPPRMQFQKLFRQLLVMLAISLVCTVHYVLVVASFERDLHDYVQRFTNPQQPQRLSLKYFSVTNSFFTLVLLVWQPLFHLFICCMTKELWDTRRKLTLLSGMKYQYERD